MTIRWLSQSEALRTEAEVSLVSVSGFLREEFRGRETGLRNSLLETLLSQRGQKRSKGGHSAGTLLGKSRLNEEF